MLLAWARNGPVFCSVFALARLGSDLAVLPSAYETVVRQDAAGSREFAVDEVARWPKDRVRAAVVAARSLAAGASQRTGQDCVSRLQWLHFFAAAAVMLHTDVALRPHATRAPRPLHEWAAGEMATLAYASPTSREFVRDWYVAMALRAERDTHPTEAPEWADGGLKLFHENPDLLLVVAAVHEALGASSRPAVTPDAVDASFGWRADPATFGTTIKPRPAPEVRKNQEATGRPTFGTTNKPRPSSGPARSSVR
jgi:hypothetical protein